MSARFTRNAKVSTRSGRGKKWLAASLRKLKPFGREQKGARRKKSGLGRLFWLAK